MLTYLGRKVMITYSRYQLDNTEIAKAVGEEVLGVIINRALNIHTHVRNMKTAEVLVAIQGGSNQINSITYMNQTLV